MNNPLEHATTALRDTQKICEAVERAMREWGRRNAWPPRHGDSIPVTGGEISDPTARTAEFLAKEAHRDLADVLEARRLLTAVLERRRIPVATINRRTCINCGWREPSRHERCAACAEHLRTHGTERPRRLIEADRNRRVYGRV